LAAFFPSASLPDGLDLTQHMPGAVFAAGKNPSSMASMMRMSHSALANSVSDFGLITRMGSKLFPDPEVNLISTGKSFAAPKLEAIHAR